MDFRSLLFGITFLVAATTSAQEKRYSQDFIYVKFVSSIDQTQAANHALTEIDARIIGSEPISRQNSKLNTSSILFGLYKLKVAEGTDIPLLLEKLNKNSNVIYAEPVYQEQLLYFPNDPSVEAGNAEHLTITHAYEAWDITRGDSAIIVGIVDSGLDLDHEDIQDKYYRNPREIINGIDDDGNGYVDDYRGYDFADRDNDPQCTADYHGNRVGGVVGAATDNGLGVAAIGFNTTIAALKSFSDINNHSNGGYEAILYAADNGYDIVNLSWGSPGSYSQANQDIISYAVLEKDLVVVAAGGNTPEELDFYPASYENVLSVGATDFADEKANFSTFSYNIDLVAPGVPIYSTANGGYGTDGGTSYSSPMAAATCALVKSVFPEYNALQVMEQVRVTTDDIYFVGNNSNYQGKLGSGRLNVFKAVSNDSAKSVRMKDIHFNNGLGELVFYGDTVRLNGNLTNYLNPLQSGVIRFSSNSPYLNWLKEEIPIGSVGTLESMSLSEKLFTLSEETPPNTRIDLQMDFNDIFYSDRQSTYFVTEADRYDLDNNQIRLSLFGNGSLGQDSLNRGLGLEWTEKLTGARLGLILASNFEQVSDNLPNQLAQENNDFRVDQFVRAGSRSTADFVVTNRFEDTHSESPAGIKVNQTTLTSEGSDYVILEYRLINTLPDVQILNCGLLIDWALGNPTENAAYFDELSKTLITQNALANTFSGLKVLNQEQAIHQALDLSSENGNTADLVNLINDSLKFILTSESLFDNAGSVGSGNDVAVLAAQDSIEIAGFDDKKVTFAIGFGKTSEEVVTNIEEAATHYQQFIELPPLLEHVLSCRGGELTIKPSKGTTFRFFSDPRGQNNLTTGDSLTLGALFEDSVVYVVNLDQGYPGPIQRISIQILERVTEFVLSTDTLFLDQEVNTVSFIDQSFKPSSWKWDFGNGLRSTLQNPTVSFSEPGLYAINLTVQNELGCSDTRTKNLLVVQRPPIPNIAPVQRICHGESLSLSASNADSLAFYSAVSLDTPVLRTTEFTIPAIQRDTGFYVTNIDGPFESLAVHIQISVSQVEAVFTYSPDTTTADLGVIFKTSEYFAETFWYLNGAFFDNTNEISVLLAGSEVEIGLTAIDTIGCRDSVRTTVSFRESPLPEVPVPQTCFGGEVILIPKNGEIFGFYEDIELASLLKKGSFFQIRNVTDTIELYVVGLDSILPSEPVFVRIVPDRPHVNIQITPDTLILANDLLANLTVSSTSNLVKWEWYLDGLFVESTESPVLFFNEPGNYQVVVTVTDELGCQNSDSVSYVVLDEIPKLLSEIDLAKDLIYPNPTDGILKIVTNQFTTFTLFDAAGKVVCQESLQQTRETINLSGLPEGIYYYQLSGGNHLKFGKIILETSD